MRSCPSEFNLLLPVVCKGIYPLSCSFAGSICAYIALSDLSAALPRFLSLPLLPFYLCHLAGLHSASVTSPVCSEKLTSVLPRVRAQSL